MISKFKIVQINLVVIFVITGILYVFLEVLKTSILAPSMIEKYHFNPVVTTLYEVMAFQPPYTEITDHKVYLQPIRRLSTIGASSIWMFFVGGLSGLGLFLLYMAKKNKFNIFFLSLTGTVIITVLELLSGLLLNGWLRLYIWDYTDNFMNLLGQISLQHSAIYFFIICPFAFWLFHFLQAQFPENNLKIYSLTSHYRYLFRVNAEDCDSMVKNILNVN
jgi:hypothetical protein